MPPPVKSLKRGSAIPKVEDHDLEQLGDHVSQHTAVDLQVGLPLVNNFFVYNVKLYLLAPRVLESTQEDCVTKEDHVALVKKVYFMCGSMNIPSTWKPTFLMALIMNPRPRATCKTLRRLVTDIETHISSMIVLLL
ncbi:hypothetical protein BC941DRAFT_507356 [Chlamydoabsidia padenii]|nr:hypothetical protein BC941DRAFT_507356 [Chlamydoabsidia padenii]